MRVWFARHRTMEVTFEAERAHLGLETQRQWLGWAIGWTTPAVFGLYSLVALMAYARQKAKTRVVRTAARYAKMCLTFSNALKAVRREV